MRKISRKIELFPQITVQMYKKKLSTTKCGGWISVLAQKTLMFWVTLKFNLDQEKRHKNNSEVTVIKTALNLGYHYSVR